MRIGMLTAAGGLLLVARMGAAQTPPTKPLPPDVPSTGVVDLGLRSGDTDGDNARFERYRDTRNGAASAIGIAKLTDRYRFRFEATSVGYRDQQYSASYTDGRLQLAGMFDGVPLNYLERAPSVWQSDGTGRMTLDLAARQQVQNRTAVGVPCAPGAPPATCNAATSVAALANRSIYNQLIVPTDMRMRRDTVGGRLSFAVTPALAVDLDLTSTGRQGSMPWAASFAFNNVNEFAVPVDQRNNEVRAGTEWVKGKGTLRLDYWGSFFGNSIQTLTWDNPIRATDFTPYDGNGYSNGNGPATGQSALWPSNMLNAVGMTGLYRPLPRTTVNGNLQVTYMRQNEALLPWSTNSAVTTPAVYAQFPGLRALPRSSAQASVNAMNALVNVSSRPVSYLTLQGRYRYNRHDNTTPSFDGREYVRFDAVPEALDDDPLTDHVEGFSEYFDITRRNLDLNGTFSLRRFGALRAGYAHEGFEREGRGFSDVGEHTLRLAYDAMLAQRVSVRANYDRSRRRGDGFIVSGVDYEVLPGGAQPGLRFYDEADRNRERSSVMLSVHPVDTVGLFVQYATTRDRFLADEFIPAGREPFGLLSQHVEALTAGIDVTPDDRVHLGVSMGRDEYDSLQKSRNAVPPPDPSWTDPARNWQLHNQERVRTLTGYADLLGLLDARLDLRLSYEYSDSENDYTFGGPRIAALSTLGQFVPLPAVMNDWTRLTGDVKYFFTRHFGIGIGGWYDRLAITDWNTIDTNGPVGLTPATGQPRIDYLGGLISGYGNRPYTGRRAFARLLYRF